MSGDVDTEGVAVLLPEQQMAFIFHPCVDLKQPACKFIGFQIHELNLRHRLAWQGWFAKIMYKEMFAQKNETTQIGKTLTAA